MYRCRAKEMWLRQLAHHPHPFSNWTAIARARERYISALVVIGEHLHVLTQGDGDIQRASASYMGSKAPISRPRIYRRSCRSVQYYPDAQVWVLMGSRRPSQER
jgi:hypothetical protein